MPDEEVNGPDDLYGLEPTAFVAARNLLARRLKAEGQPSEAAAVTALRRPPVSAWALNQVARRHPDLVDDALAAAQRLRLATEAAMTGDAAGLREAAAEEREASGALVAAAVGQLRSGSEAARSRIATTVHAAVVDEAVAGELRRGVLSGDHDRSGLGLGDLSAWSVPTGPPTLRVVQGGKQDESSPAEPSPAAAPSPAPVPAERASRAQPTSRAERKPPADRQPPADREQRRREAAEQAARERAERTRIEDDARARRKRLTEVRQAADLAARRAARLRRDAERLDREASEARDDADAAATAAEAARRAVEELEVGPGPG